MIIFTPVSDHTEFYQVFRGMEKAVPKFKISLGTSNSLRSDGDSEEHT